MGAGSPLGMAGCLSSPHVALFQDCQKDRSHPLWFDCRTDQMSCCFLRDPNNHLRKQTRTAEGGEPQLWVSATAQQMLFPNLCLTNGFGCKNPGKDLAAELLLAALSSHGRRSEGAEVWVPLSWGASRAGPTGRSLASCAHTHSLHPHQPCCPGHRKSLLGAAGKTLLREKHRPAVLLAIMANLCFTPCRSSM